MLASLSWARTAHLRGADVESAARQEPRLTFWYVTSRSTVNVQAIRSHAYWSVHVRSDRILSPDYCRGRAATDECFSMALGTIIVICPHCEAEIDVRIETQATVVPSLKLAFASLAEFAQWLKASRLSVDEFRQLPVYQWHRDQLEPLVRAVANDAEDEMDDEWRRDQLGAPTRAVAHDDHTANAEPGLDKLSDAPNL